MQTTREQKYSIRKNDTVQIIAGKEKGKSGKVLKVDAKTGRVTIEKINMVKRHTKASQQNRTGGIVEKELPIHYSNVQLMCAKCNRGVRHGIKLIDQSAGKKTAKKAGTETSKQKKIRVCKRCGESLETA